MRKFNDPSIDYYFTADLHLGHANIIKYDKQDYKDIYQRDEDIVKKWNETVRPKDVVFLLGDVGFMIGTGDRNDISYIKGIVSRLNGNLKFIKGNHDSKPQILMFEELGEYLGPLVDIFCMKQKISLCHYQMNFWRDSHRGAWHLHGHNHCCNKDPKDKFIIDVGINGWGMKPLNFSKIKTIMSKKDYVIEYHHDVFTDISRQ